MCLTGIACPWARVAAAGCTCAARAVSICAETSCVDLCRLFQVQCRHPSWLQGAAATTSHVAAPEVPVTLHSLQLMVENLAGGLGHHKLYKSFHPAHRLPALPGGGTQTTSTASAASDGASPTLPGQAQLKESLQAAVAASTGQVSALEAHYSDLLRQLSALSREVCVYVGVGAAQ